MANLLISGPAGSGKTEAARREIDQASGPAVAADFQSILAALTLRQRLPNGRYPPRSARDDALLPLVEYIRRSVITVAVERDITIITTNSDGSIDRRTLLRSQLGANATERVIDPGRAIVEARLSDEDGELSDQCEKAIKRWYDRI